jgi:hypothetical protein
MTLHVVRNELRIWLLAQASDREELIDILSV